MDLSLADEKLTLLDTREIELKQVLQKVRTEYLIDDIAHCYVALLYQISNEVPTGKLGASHGAIRIGGH